VLRQVQLGQPVTDRLRAAHPKSTPEIDMQASYTAQRALRGMQDVHRLPANEMRRSEITPPIR
jgi:hypothetical protein